MHDQSFCETFNNRTACFTVSFSLLVLQRVEFIREFQRRHTCCTNHGHLICFVKHVTVILEKTYIRRVSSHFVPSHFVPSYSHIDYSDVSRYVTYCHNVPTRGLLAVETMHAIVQWLENLNVKGNMTSMFVSKKHRYSLFYYPLPYLVILVRKLCLH